MSDAPSRLAAALSDRYRIERELGAGGMATVYLAHDLKHERQVAIKVLKPELAAVLGADRFVAEIKTTAALQHPHILPLFDSGQVVLQPRTETRDSRLEEAPSNLHSPISILFYVMPYIQGETLRDKLNRETQLGVDEAVRITREVADALDYAHRHGVVHRDIKPENILLHDGRPMVADFGIALAVSAAAGGRMTETGLSLGTPHYMSPEQATADKEITGRSDIYSLASVCYEMLTGNPPHTGSSAQQIIMKIVAEEAQPVTRLRKSVPANVAAAIAKALEKLPADRFATAKEFADALADPHYGERTAATPAGAGRRGTSWLLLAGVAIGGLLVGGLATRLLGPRSVAISDTVRRQLTFNGRAQHPAIAPDGSLVAYVDVECRHGRDALCRSTLMVQEVGGTKAEALVHDAIDMGTPRWTADGETLVIGAILDNARQGIFAVPRLSATPRLIAAGGIYDTHPSADSVVVVSQGPRDTSIAQIIDLASASVARSVRWIGGHPTDIAWSPDGRRWALTDETRLTLVAPDGTVTDTLDAGGRPSLRWSPDGRSLIYVQVGAVREDELIRQDVNSDGHFAGAPVVLLSRVPTLYQGDFDVARRSGDLALMTGDANSDIWSFTLATSPIKPVRRTHGTTWYGEPAVSPDGTALLYYQGDALGDNIYRLDLATGGEEALTAQERPGGNRVRFSADGKRLVYGHSGAATTLEMISFPSRRIQSTTAPIFTSPIEPIGPTGLLGFRSPDQALVIADSLGAPWRPVPIDTTLRVVDVVASPDASQVLVAGVLPRGEGSRTLTDVLATIALADGTTTILDSIPVTEPIPGISWSNDGTIWVGRWLDADEWPSLWKGRVGGGRITRGFTIPVACQPKSITVGKESLQAACTVPDYRSDIWLYKVPGMAR